MKSLSLSLSLSHTLQINYQVVEVLFTLKVDGWHTGMQHLIPVWHVASDDRALDPARVSYRAYHSVNSHLSPINAPLSRCTFDTPIPRQPNINHLPFRNKQTISAQQLQTKWSLPQPYRH